MAPSSPDTPQAAGPAPAKSCLVQLLGALSVLLMLGAIAEGLFAFADLHQSPAYRTPTSDLWDTVGITLGGLLFLVGASTLFHIVKRTQFSWLAALCLSFISLAGILQWFTAGLVTATETQHRGGDWAGLNVVASGLFNLGIPLFLGAVTLAALICLMLVQPRGTTATPN